MLFGDKDKLFADNVERLFQVAGGLATLWANPAEVDAVLWQVFVRAIGFSDCVACVDLDVGGAGDSVGTVFALDI